MNKNNLIRFAQSLIFLPFMTGTMPLGDITNNPTAETFQNVFIQKQNIEASGILAFNQVFDQKANDLKVKKAEAIDNYFKSYNMPLSGMGMKMVEEALKNDLDWRLLPAIAVRESTGGKFECKKVKNNAFGWGSCKIGFDSNEEAIETVARNLGGNNPKTERYYADKDIKGILQAYNPPSIVARYAHQVISIMESIGDENPILGEEANS
ncbi:MAG: hypothetical protein UR25_C0001G0056 [Candidatus Nomurabacteria bacterium GW2011_GWE1_32_28]|uniref:Mannosyl-glycoprotein endo-beta-N-acetylglucosamidase-like domain-containing protein n=1 Tax=Candidatus Nomurabacteria bacterium GW2011_GWF1_31_48 TaxID=1618767 RepID=A0A0G0AVE7_9BACT|nr:MAG: hypothetical protein UR10_C0001G0009 [Candidatus Nomurabacteria bacterium GW2011_GWF2_30_133]KKP28887.1 MAG: hypothetical protein UR18_C0001G0008 [Candidatus Nomurabacteria bacterium GW2011_GWE2_31_40]KKP30625.1 MAG: hypothetical protein UR19_C0001G0009 [Candidatus Nomurabacteria bacterium GW2011_GWF1_31_48]KKP35143.1 MAG: hypothetical protein UR25_C0001G0056 [Candidatus Nomurabacteria bacterium GW2011_GWE1_32_28]HAS80453.1 hypothetical protein [Candidatus Nomurabacteria bacterium]